MSASHRLPAAFRRLAWSNLAAQAGEQVSLAAAPLLAVLALDGWTERWRLDTTGQVLVACEFEAGLAETVISTPFYTLSSWDD